MPLIAKRAVRRLFGALAVTWLLGAATALAVEGNLPSSASDDQPITVFTDDSAAMAPRGDADKLVQYVRAQGEARVIVGLRIVTQIESTLSDAAVFSQRQAQRRVEDSILGRVFGSVPGASVVRLEFIPYMAVTVDADQVSRLLADPQVVSVKKETIFEPALAETTVLIHADKLFLKQVQGTDYVVAVIDTGVSKTTPMLVDKVVSEACYSTNLPAQNYSSFCPGGAASSVRSGSGVNCPVNVPNCDHGTHVASIAAGNSNVYDGVARDSKIIAIKAASRRAGPGCAPTPCVAFLEGDVILALKRVLALKDAFKIAAVNLSLTTRSTLFASACDTTNGELTAAFASLRAADIAPIVASGNNGNSTSVGIPACLSKAFVVGNTTKTDLVAVTSNHSLAVDLMAPGAVVTAAVPPGASCIKTVGPYCVKSGTSMAAPHVAGAFATLKSADPHRSANAILQALKCSGKTVYERAVARGSPVYLDPPRGRIDLLGAYNYLIGPVGALRTWNFATKAEITDWTIVEGPWRFNAEAPGTYEVAPFVADPNKGTPLLTALANCHAGFTAEIRFRRIDTQPFLTASGFWMKAVIDYQKHLISGYFFSFSKETNPANNLTGAAAVTEIKNWAYRENSVNTCTQANGCEMTTKCERKYVSMPQSAFQVMKVVAAGKKHTYFMNGVNVCTFEDATYTSGAIVPYAKVLPPFGDGQVFQIDRLRLTSQNISPVAAPEIVDPVMDPSALAPRRAASQVAFDSSE